MTTPTVRPPIAPETPEAPDAASVLWRDLATLVLTVGRATDQRLRRDARISVVDFDVLSALCAEPGERLRPRDLGLRLRWEKSRLSHQLRRMEARGLVERVDCETDGRGVVVAATAAGAQAYAQGAPAYRDELRQRFGRQIDPADWALLSGVSQRLLNAALPNDPATLCAGPDDPDDC